MTLRVINFNCGNEICKTTWAMNEYLGDDKTVLLLQEPNNKVVAQIDRNLHHVNEKNNCLTVTRMTWAPREIKSNGAITTVTLNNKRIAIASIYLSPSITLTALKKELEDISKMLNSVRHLPIIVGGDFNAENQLWSHTTRRSLRAKGFAVSECLSDLDLIPYTEPNETNNTFEREDICKGWIDSVLHTSNLKVTQNKVFFPFRPWDHKVIEVVFDVMVPQETPKMIKKVNYDKWFESLCDSVPSVTDIERCDKEELENLANKLIMDTIETKENHTQIVKRTAVSRNSKSHKKLIALIRKLTKRKKKSEDKSRDEIIEQLKRDLKEKVNDSMNKYFRQEDGSIRWKRLERLLNKGQEIQTSPQFEANKKELEKTMNEKCNIENLKEPTFLLNISGPEIDDSAVVEAVKGLNRKAAPGIDGLETIMFIELFKVKEKEICCLIRSLCKKAMFPSAWKISRAVIIPKSDGIRPRLIQVLPAIARTMEIVVINYLNTIIKESFFQNQYAYQKERSSTDLMNDLRNWMWQGKENRANTYVMRTISVVLADVESAFDKINQKDIISALMKAGIDNKWTNLVVSFLLNRRVAIRTEKTIECKKLTTGTPAGSGLGPCLFIIGFQNRLNAINSISIHEEHQSRKDTQIKALMYADDIIMGIKVGAQRLPLRTVQVIDKMKGCVTGNGLDILPQKSKILATESNKLNFKNLNFEIIQETKILGYHYEHGLNMINARAILREAEEKMHRTMKSVKTLSLLPTDIRQIVDNAYLRSNILSYAPLILRQVLNNASLQSEGERIYGYLYRAAGKTQNQRFREVWTYIFDGGSFVSKVMEIALKYFYKRQFTKDQMDIEFKEILEKKPRTRPKT